MTIMLINTYLDQDCFHKLEELTETTHASISDVLKQAIDFYYEQVKPPQPRAAEMLLYSGFVGCGEAEPTWSENYKAELVKLINDKHDNG